MLIRKTIKSILLGDFLRFVIVGIISTIFNYSLFYLLLQFLHVSYLLSSWTWYVAWLVLWYFFNKTRTFQQKGGHKIKKIVWYVLVYAFSLISWLWILYLLVNKLNIDARIANILVIWYSTITNFLWTKYLVFTRKKNDGF